MDVHCDFNTRVSIDRAQCYTVNLIIEHSRESRSTSVAESQAPIGIYVIALDIRSTSYPLKRSTLNFCVGG